MKRLHPSLRQLLLAILGTLASGAVRAEALPQRPSKQDSTRVKAETVRLTSELQARVVADAKANYTQGGDIEAVEVPKGSLEHTNPARDIRVVARTMTRKTQPDVYQLVAVFNADKPYKKLGLGPNDNYVWRIPVVGDTVYVMVPSDLATPMTFLEYNKHNAFMHPTHKPPQVVKEVVASGTLAGVRFVDLVLGGCVDGPQCPAGHCAVSGSGTRFMFTDYRKLMRARRR